MLHTYHDMSSGDVSTGQIDNYVQWWHKI